jgi:4-diphosphocytidyl-2-C-methyl-D-erythritol kinase
VSLEQVRCPAPAKLNLMLRIVGRRVDGYHLLQTVFQLIDLHDWLTFRVREDGLLRRANDWGDVPAEQDLVVRAARLLQQRGGVSLGVDIELDKRIPMGAGLGGGSSDAATCLLALNRLWGLDWQLDELARLAVTLGADVPVFVQGRSAWGEGVGERLRAVDLPQRWFLVVLPAARIATAEIFSDRGLTRNSPPIKMHDFLRGDHRNDCLPVVLRRYPQVADLLDAMSVHGEVRLTGTGAALFLESEQCEPLQVVQAQLPDHVASWLVRGLRESPMQSFNWGVAKR